jgi:mono/diheme cytochrome c family protein
MIRTVAAYAALLAALAAASQERPAAPPLPDEPEKLAPGLALTFESGGASDTRAARVAALYVPEGEPPSPFLPPGPFKALFEGFVSVDLGTDCTFSTVGTGSVTVTINEKPAAEGNPVFLKKGRNRIAVRYESPARGDAWLRLSWSSTDFPKEPLGPLVTSHDSNARPLRAQRRLREGRELVASRRCLRCHADPARGAPELDMDAPSLEDAGARLEPGWVEKWVQGPRALRPEATMPHPAGVTPQDAADLAAYLEWLGSARGGEPPPPDGARAGGHLFAELRCVGCHTLPEKDAAPDRIPLRHVKAKWKPAALKEFLKAPDRHYAWIEMPSFGLTDQEAARLAAFLLSRKGEEIPPSGRAGDATRGAARFQALGCLSCHKAPGANAFQAPALRAIPPAGWSRGCMAGKPDGRSPDFGFSEAQRQAVLAFAATDLSSLSRESPPEFLERQVKALRCQACHKRDRDHDYWSDLAGEAKDLLPPKKEDPEFAEVQAADPQAPPLTWIGEKLKPEWMAAFLKDPARDRLRPYLGAFRMPAWKSRAELLARGLVLSHGCPPASPPDPEPNAELAEVGRKLSGANGGFDCLQCHGIGPKAATKVFEAPGPNFKHSRARLRKDYFDRWVRKPLAVEPGTKMPEFFRDGRSQLVEVFDGDADRQIEAIWQYLLQGEKIRPPAE